MSRNLPDHFTSFKEAHPDVCEAFEALGRLVHESGPLSERERRLVKLGIAVGVNTEGAVHSAVRHAIGGGCTAEDMEHVVHLAITTLGWPRAMAALSWVGDVVEAPSPRARGRGKKGGRSTAATPRSAAAPRGDARPKRAKR